MSENNLEAPHSHEACHRLLGSLSAYLDGEAADSLCQEIERHMESCERCRIVIDTLAMTVKLYREQEPSALPEAARQRLYVSLKLEDFLSKQSGG
jgi:predicted anti-sigma-YlaC factor YlaD